MKPLIIATGLLLSLLLSGCAQWPASVFQRPDANPSLPADPLAAARNLAAEDRLGEALAMLDTAIDQGWNGEEYMTAREETLARKTRLEQELQDRLLIQQTRALQHQLPFLGKLALIDPKDRKTARRIEEIASRLQANRRQLSDCGLRHLEHQASLARTCLELALSLESSRRDRLLLATLEEREQKTAQLKAQRQQTMLEQERSERIENNLHRADALYRQDRFEAARNLLNQVLAEAPDNPQARRLLTQLEKRLQEHLAKLLQTGDRLYQEGEIEGAQNLWKAALHLDPDNTLAKEKLERAKRVLENMEQLRRTNESQPEVKVP